MLHFDAPLWGHVISYSGNTVQVVLKAAPARSTEPNKPLAGVKVLLDAGHGDADAGAMGGRAARAPRWKRMQTSLWPGPPSTGWSSLAPRWR